MSNLVFGTKQPYEEYYVTFDFVNDMDEDDSIANENATITVMNGAVDVTATLTDVDKQTASGTKVFVWVRGGTTATTYVITCKIVTTVLAEKYETEADLPVAET